MFGLILLLLLLGLILGPGLWVKRVIARYSEPADRYEQSGAATARQLLKVLGLEGVGVEVSESGDHYDPQDKVVRLEPRHYEGRSLAAVTIAAHEVGHALQDARAYVPLRMRTRLVRWVGPVEKMGALLLMATPVIIGLSRVPAAGLLFFLGGFLSLGAAVLVHMLTLPTEFDASFGRALPLLDEHDLLHRVDRPHARKLLKAAAMTYVAASLMSLLNIARWWAILRR